MPCEIVTNVHTRLHLRQSHQRLYHAASIWSIKMWDNSKKIVILLKIYHSRWLFFFGLSLKWVVIQNHSGSSFSISIYKWLNKNLFRFRNVWEKCSFLEIQPGLVKCFKKNTLKWMWARKKQRKLHRAIACSIGHNMNEWRKEKLKLKFKLTMQCMQFAVQLYHICLITFFSFVFAF